jgi:hypothetical protein
MRVSGFFLNSFASADRFVPTSSPTVLLIPTNKNNDALKTPVMFQFKKRYVYITLLAVYSFLNILLIEGDRLFAFEVNWGYLFITLFLDVMLIWEVNRMLGGTPLAISKKIPYKIHPLVVHFFMSQLGALLVSVLTTVFILPLLEQPFTTFQINLKLCIGFTSRVNLFLNCVNAIVYFMQKLSEAKIQSEKLEKRSAEAQFEALRNQINPHFLFNSLNVLSSLVYKSPDTAVEFILQLSKVYRYLLYYQEKKLVALWEELDFIQSYIFLVKIRFKDNLSITQDIQVDVQQYFIIPACLQLLIENAFKHNIVSAKKPLHIHIYTECNTWLVVSNNYQERKTKEDSTSVGLKNIAERYKFISDHDIVVEKSAENFTVKLPLVKLESQYENPDR